jgi:hypothetical protein
MEFKRRKFYKKEADMNEGMYLSATVAFEREKIELMAIRVLAVLTQIWESFCSSSHVFLWIGFLFSFSVAVNSFPLQKEIKAI